MKLRVGERIWVACEVQDGMTHETTHELRDGDTWVPIKPVLDDDGLCIVERDDAAAGGEGERNG